MDTVPTTTATAQCGIDFSQIFTGANMTGDLSSHVQWHHAWARWLFLPKGKKIIPFLGLPLWDRSNGLSTFPFSGIPRGMSLSRYRG